MLVVHPDRCSNMDTETKFIAKRIFEAINEAYEEFLKKEVVLFVSLIESTYQYQSPLLEPLNGPTEELNLIMRTILHIFFFAVARIIISVVDYFHYCILCNYSIRQLWIGDLDNIFSREDYLNAMKQQIKLPQLVTTVFSYSISLCKDRMLPNILCIFVQCAISYLLFITFNEGILCSIRLIVPLHHYKFRFSRRNSFTVIFSMAALLVQSAQRFVLPCFLAQ